MLESDVRQPPPAVPHFITVVSGPVVEKPPATPAVFLSVSLFLLRPAVVGCGLLHLECPSVPEYTGASLRQCEQFVRRRSARTRPSERVTLLRYEDIADPVL